MTARYDREKPEDYSDWRKTAGFVLSIQRPHIFAVMEGQIRPTEETDDAGTDGADTGRISPAPLVAPGFLDTTGGTLQQRQTAFDRTNQDLYAIMYLATDKAAALLVAMHAYDERGTVATGRKRSRNWRRSTSGSPTKLSAHCRWHWRPLPWGRTKTRNTTS